MAYWLCITNEENWEIIKKNKIWGVAEKHQNTISKVKKGDRCLIYVKQEKIGDELKESRIVGEYEVISEVFKDSKRIFKSPPNMRNESFPYRIKLKPIKVFKKPIEFKPLIPKLNFIKNKRKWSGHLMGRAMRQIPEEDYRLIVEKK